MYQKHWRVASNIPVEQEGCDSEHWDALVDLTWTSDVARILAALVKAPPGEWEPYTSCMECAAAEPIPLRRNPISLRLISVLLRASRNLGKPVQET